MGDSITNFFELLTKGDFFLIFLIAMMLIIIGVIVYLVRLQINDVPDYEKIRKDREEEEEEDDYYYDDAYIEEEVINDVKEPVYSESYDKPVKEEAVIKFEPLKSVESLEEDTQVIDNDVDNMLSEGISISEDVEDLVSESSMVYKDEDFESPAHSRPRFIEQSKFDFDNSLPLSDFEEEEEETIEDSIQDSVIDSFKDYEDEQEATAIISARELETRINELKANGLYESHERQLEEYEREQETKAIISYEELLERASQGAINYESEEVLGGGIHVGKVDTSNIEHYSEVNDKPYYKEESFLEAMKEFRRAL